MRHVKLYESWINESASSNIPKILDSGLLALQEEFDMYLNDLSMYGNFGSQIRSNISEYRSKYLSSGVWNSLKTKEGIESSLRDFKKLFFEATSAKYFSQISELTSKAIHSDLTDKIWNSTEAVKAATIIKNGDYKLSQSVAAGIIFSQLAIAITKGLYYYSASIPFKVDTSSSPYVYGNYSIEIKESLEKIKNLQNVLDVVTSSDEKIEEFYMTAERFFQKAVTVTKMTAFQAGTHGRAIPYPREVTEYWTDFDKIEPFIKELSFDKLINDFNQQISSGNDIYYASRSFFSLLFYGNRVANSHNNGLNLLSTFMETGGPSWYQKILG